MQAARESKWTGEHNRASQVEAWIEGFFKNDKDGIISDDKELKKFNEFIDSTPYDPYDNPYKYAYQKYQKEVKRQDLDNPKTSTFESIVGKTIAGAKNLLLGTMYTITKPFSND